MDQPRDAEDSMMPEESRDGLFDPDEEWGWDCDLPYAECNEGGDDFTETEE